MDIRGFLAFERKKIVLPVVLICMLTFVLVLGSLYANNVKNDVKDVVDSSLEVVKLSVYNTNLNGTEPSIETQLFVARNMAEANQHKLVGAFLTSFASYIPEYVLNTFGTSFCNTITGGKQTSCAATELDLAIPIEVVRVTGCAALFVGQIQNETKFPGLFIEVFDETAGRSGKKPNIEAWREFALSPRGQNIFNEFEYCSYPKARELIFSPQKLEAFGSIDGSGILANISNSSLISIHLLSPLDVLWFAAVIFVTSYLLSCLVLWIHRKNAALYGKGRETYMVIVGFLAILFWFFVVVIHYLDFRIVFFLSFVLAYIATTYLWKIYGSPRESDEDRILKKVRRYKITKKR